MPPPPGSKQLGQMPPLSMKFEIGCFCPCWKKTGGGGKKNCDSALLIFFLLPINFFSAPAKINPGHATVIYIIDDQILSGFYIILQNFAVKLYFQTHISPVLINKKDHLFEKRIAFLEETIPLIIFKWFYSYKLHKIIYK